MREESSSRLKKLMCGFSFNLKYWYYYNLYRYNIFVINITNIKYHLSSIVKYRLLDHLRKF